MKTYYNEFDPNAAQWIRNLGEENIITRGTVDERSIKDVQGNELAGVRRAHFFAGIGGWDYALRLAGWPEDDEVWTASCPCQPYSAAGKQEGDEDPRNLWPDCFRLIGERLPRSVFGEQVASAIKFGWLDRVFTDLEGIGYACGAAVLGAHSVGAPHIRKRLYWFAARGLAQDAAGLGRGRGRDGDSAGDNGQVQAPGLRATGGLANGENADGRRGERGEEAGAGPQGIRGGGIYRRWCCWPDGRRPERRTRRAAGRG